MRRGLLVAAAGLSLILAGGLLALLDPSWREVQPEPSRWPSLLAGLGGAAVLAGAWLERRSLRRALATRQARFGSIALAYTALVLVGLASLATLVEGLNWRLDLTRDRSASLEPDTLRVLRAIPDGGSDVEVFGFVAGGGLQPVDSAAARGELGPVFELLAKASPRLRTSFVDATRDPSLTRSLGISRLPSVAVRWKAPDEDEARVVRTDLLSEAEIARAIDEILLGVKVPIDVVQGHGEMAVGDMEGSAGLFKALMAVAGDNYEVRPLHLAEAGAVPEDARILLIAGPQSDYLSAEVELLRGFTKAGGRLLLLLGPAFDDRGRVRAMPVLAGWLREQFGVELGRGVVCDLEGLSGPGADLRTIVLPAAPDSPHPIVRGRDRLLVLPFARPVKQLPELPHGTALDVLLRSGPRSWEEAESPSAPAFDPADERGPLPLAVAISFQPFGQEKAARLVVLGSHLFASNAYVPLAGNASLLLDSVAWLDERDEVLEARRRRGRDGTAVIPYQQGVLILLCAAATPLVLAGFGVVTWWHRRRL